MIAKKLRIIDETGLHLRPAGNLCKKACKYKCRVEFKTARGVYNAKSILSVLGACVKKGDEIELMCDGEDEEEAALGLSELINGGIGDDFRVNE